MSAQASVVKNSGPVVQRRFDFPDLKTGRPLMSVNAVMGWLDKSEDDIKYLWEDGLLRYAFDIRSAGAAKSEVRILADSVRAYIRGDHVRLLSTPRVEDDLDAVLKCLFAHSRSTVRGTEVKRAFNCSSQHVLDLLEELAIGRDEKVKLKTPKSSPGIYRSSVIAFLKSRRLP